MHIVGVFCSQTPAGPADRDHSNGNHMCVSKPMLKLVHIYIYIYIEREREI